MKVFISHRDSTCDECGENLGTGAWITLQEEKGALCLSCADLDHLLFLASGDAALTRRATRHSALSAIVLKWSRARKRYERQGTLVTAEALELAEQECLADQDGRARRQERAAERRAELDHVYVAEFAAAIRNQFPRCPSGREQVIAEHACQKYSGRVGRCAAAKCFDEPAVRLAVIAHVRHAETPYDRLLAQDFERHAARIEVERDVRKVLAAWGPKGGEASI